MMLCNCPFLALAASPTHLLFRHQLLCQFPLLASHLCWKHTFFINALGLFSTSRVLQRLILLKVSFVSVLMDWLLRIVIYHHPLHRALLLAVSTIFSSMLQLPLCPAPPNDNYSPSSLPCYTLLSIPQKSFIV